MQRRGRPGRDRSRDPSRPFFQGRERDFDRNYRNREERHPGYWDDIDRRGGGGRDDRLSHLHHPALHPPPSLAPTPSGPPSGPAGHPSDQLPNYPRDPSSKGSHSRRDSRDSISRETLPLDTSRRHSGGPFPRKEFAEPSPRERGMIGDSQVGSRRQISNSGWSRGEGDERPRSSDTRRNSIDRGRPSRSPIVESPRSIAPPASPATSITATPTTATNLTTSFTAALMAPSASMHPATAGGSKDQTRYALIFQEASSAYTRYLEAENSFKTAEKERGDHAEHFNAFPAMKDRYEGNAKVAKRELSSAQEILKQKSAPLEDLCRELFKEQISQQNYESAIKFLNQVKKELGNSTSLTQFIKSNITPQVQGPPKDEFQELRDSLRDMKKKQEDEEKLRQNVANEFLNYKSEQLHKSRSQDKRLDRLETAQKELKTEVDRIKDEHRKMAEGLKKAMALLTTTKSSFDKLQEASDQRAKGGGDVLMSDASNDVGTLGGRVDDVSKILEVLLKSIITNHQKLAQATSRSETEIKNLQQKVPGVTQAQEDSGPLAREEYSTKADILRLEGQIRGQDEILDALRTGAENDTTTILEVISTLEQKTEGHIQATKEEFQSLEEKTNKQVTNFLTIQEEEAKNTHAAEIKEIDKKFTTNFANFHNKFLADVVDFGNRVGYAEGQLESLILAINHVDQRMTNFTTKDFYERVVQELIKINPLLFNYTTQLNTVTHEMKIIKDTVRGLGGQIKLAEQRLTQANLSPRPQDGLVANDGPSNGSLKSDRSSEGPSPSFSTVLGDLGALRGKVDKIEEDLAKHIDIYLKRMDDIKDWTASAAQRLAENTESATAIAEDIKDLRTYLSSGQTPGNSAQITNNGMRWRVVGNNQDAMQGLPDENGNG